ncbi:hypothetical protein [Wenjunlia vitaminophila]|uniref:hypothetical protein n=1 Tax=Wenjunlia vitaminophila TaxID=76728 RepID=UPI0003A14B04|nr:hypothetical protein [Wenjunlia vitaminophila]
MPPSTGDQYTIRIGGDASGPVVAGHDNQVEVHQPGESDADAGATQKTTVRDHGTSYTVMRGELNIHHGAPGRSSEPEPEEN